MQWLAEQGPALTYSIIFITCSVFLCLFAVRERLRIGWVPLAFITLGLGILNYVFRSISWLGILPLLAVAFFIYTKVADVHPMKLIYIMLVVVTYILFSNSVFFIFERSSYTWGYSELDTVLIGFSVSMPLMTWFIRKKIWPTLRVLDTSNYPWLWVIPTSFIIMNVLLSSSHTQSLLSERLAPAYILMTSVFAVACAGTCFLMLNTLKKTQQVARVEANMELIDRQLSTQAKRFEELTRHMERVRVIRHDMRHHLRVLGQLLAEGEVGQAQAFLKEYESEVSQQETRQISANFVGDIIARHSYQQAEDAGIDCEIQCALPAKCWVADSDLCIVLGNLMENALIACTAQKTGRKYIHATARIAGPEAIITIENSCDDTDDAGSRIELGLPCSTGLGIPSIRAIAQKYGGTAVFEKKAGVFSAAVLMYQQKPLEAESA